MAESPETSSYPASLDTWTTLTDKEDLAEASDINKLKNAVTSTQTELGTDVAGSATDLKTRLAVSIGDDGGVKGDTSFPGSPVGDQLFTRTDEDKLYRRDTSNSSWVEIAGGGHNLLSTTTVSAASASGDITVGVQTNYLVRVDVTATSASSVNFLLRFNNDSGSNYWYVFNGVDTAGTASTGNSNSATGIQMGGNYDVSATDYFLSFYFRVGGQGTGGAKNKHVQGNAFGNISGSNGRWNTFMGRWGGSADASTFDITASTGTYTGTIYVYEYQT